MRILLNRRHAVINGYYEIVANRAARCCYHYTSPRRVTTLRRARLPRINHTRVVRHTLVVTVMSGNVIQRMLRYVVTGNARRRVGNSEKRMIAQC